MTVIDHRLAEIIRCNAVLKWVGAHYIKGDVYLAKY